jgi:hypothetical protein
LAAASFSRQLNRANTSITTALSGRVPALGKDHESAAEGSRLRSVRAMTALGFTGTLAPSSAGRPTLGQVANVEPGGVWASEPPQAEMPTLSQKDSVEAPDAGPPRAAKNDPFAPAHRSHKAAHARRQLKMPPRTGSRTTQLNQQEMVRHQTIPPPPRDPVSNFLKALFH